LRWARGIAGPAQHHGPGHMEAQQAEERCTEHPPPHPQPPTPAPSHPLLSPLSPPSYNHPPLNACPVHTHRTRPAIAPHCTVQAHAPSATAAGMSRVPATSREMAPWYQGARLPAHGAELNRFSSAYAASEQRRPEGRGRRAATTSVHSVEGKANSDPAGACLLTSTFYLPPPPAPPTPTPPLLTAQRGPRCGVQAFRAWTRSGAPQGSPRLLARSAALDRRHRAARLTHPGEAV
jgi:hypothetical protein